MGTYWPDRAPRGAFASQARRPVAASGSSSRLLLAWTVDVCGLAEEHFRGFHHGLRERRMRVDAQLQVGGVGAHLDGKHTLGDQLTRSRTDDADAQHAFSLGV